MSRGGNGEMRNVNSALETINAAATAIASAESRVPPPTVQKRRWSSCWSIYWCFGSQKNTKRIGHAVLVPEPTPPVNGTIPPPTENAPTQPPPIRIPFVAPPSSPASFLPSEPPSSIHSPACSVGPNSMSANMYSPGGPRSIFAIGPYAHETQLVTPPVFSTYTTEPSTAPFTPPPESVHLTTPSSPEVPFAQLLDPIHRTVDMGPRFTSSHYEFQSYLLHPGSPVGPLISPGSAFSGSGASSPFPDRENIPYFPPYGVPPKLTPIEGGPTRGEWGGSRQASGSVTLDGAWPRYRERFPLNRQDSMVPPLPNLPNGGGYRNNNNDVVVDHRVSFELTAEDVVRCVEKKPMALPKALQKNTDERDDDDSRSDLVDDDHDNAVVETTDEAPGYNEEGQRHQRQRAASLGSIKEFHFDHINGVADSDDKPCISSNWWAANEKVVGRTTEGESASKNWSFFPMMQPSVS